MRLSIRRIFKRIACYAPFAFLLIGSFYLVSSALPKPLPSSKNPLVFSASSLDAPLKVSLSHAIKKAKHSIHLISYALSDRDMISLLNEKAKRGVNISIECHQKNALSLEKKLTPSILLKKHKTKGLMHEKILIIDDSLVFFKTANITFPSLLSHDNALLGIYSPSIASFLKSEESLFFIKQPCPLSIYRLPNGKEDALKDLIKLIDTSEARIDLALFTLTYPPLVKALIRAHKRGVHLSITVDRHTAYGSSKKALTSLIENEITPFISLGVHLLHTKCAFFDEKTFLLGSANWTKAAFKKNRDFLLMLSPPSKIRKEIRAFYKEVQRERKPLSSF